MRLAGHDGGCRAAARRARCPQRSKVMNEGTKVGTTDAATLDESLITYTSVIYALHAASALMGIITAASIVGNFLFGVPSIVAVIMNYARVSAVRGTLLESH